MTDWTRLRHAYGRADDVPGMLDRVVPDEGAEVWTELSSAICHQGTVYSASFAALPRLTEVARDWAPAEYCEKCDADMHIMLDGPRFHIYVSGVEQEGAVVPAAPDDLEPLARRLYLAAEAAGRTKTMTQLLHLFGTTACPGCERNFQVAAEVAA